MCENSTWNELKVARIVREWRMEGDDNGRYGRCDNSEYCMHMTIMIVMLSQHLISYGYLHFCHMSPGRVW